MQDCCAAGLAERAALLEAAGARRLARKADRMAEAAAAKGPVRLFMKKHFARSVTGTTAPPFRTLATRMRNRSCAKNPAACPARIRAALQTAGLPPRIDRRWDRETGSGYGMGRLVADERQMGAARLNRSDWRLSACVRPTDRNAASWLRHAFTAPKPLQEQAACLRMMACSGKSSSPA